jgi:hypothetical protein
MTAHAPEHPFRKFSPKLSNPAPERCNERSLGKTETENTSTRAERASLNENDHVSQTCSWTCCCSFSQRDGAGSLRGFREAVGRWVGRRSGGGYHHHHFGPGFGIAYADDGCYVTRRIRTPFGYRLRTVNVCY